MSDNPASEKKQAPAEIIAEHLKVLVDVTDFLSCRHALSEAKEIIETLAAAGYVIAAIDPAYPKIDRQP